MAQNIYDNPAFFEGYARLPRSVQGLDGAPEWPALKGMLPDLTGKSVVDLGCGYGWFCRAPAGERLFQENKKKRSQKRCSPARRSLPLTHRFTISVAIWNLLSLTRIASIWSTARWRCTTCRNWIRYSPGFSARSSPAAAWSFRWSTRSTPAPPVRDG